MPKTVPLRPASPIDAEIAKPHPDEMTEIEKKKEGATESEPSDDQARERRQRRTAEAFPRRFSLKR